jgi:flagellar basal-body rod modification protein FlgD
MISGVSSVLPSFEGDNNYAIKEEDKLGRDAFMKLFLAQMNHQDPLNPMDTTQFSAQLAQFSTLEQLFNVNSNLESIKSIESSGNKYQVLDLIGKEVQADSDTLVLNNGKVVKGSFYVDEPAECIVHILDEQGSSIRDIYIGKVNAGSHEFEWDGFDSRGDLHTSGQYTYTVSAMSNSGNFIYVDKYIQGTVTGVNMNDSDPVFYINDTPLSMSQIINVKMSDETES